MQTIEGTGAQLRRPPVSDLFGPLIYSGGQSFYQQDAILDILSD